MDLESALDELKAEFDAMMADEGGDDMDGMDDMDMGSDDDEDMMKNSMFEAEEEEEAEEVEGEETKEELGHKRGSVHCGHSSRREIALSLKRPYPKALA